MRKIILILMIMFTFGCNKENNYSNLNNLSNTELMDKLDKSINYIKMFPNEEYENEFVSVLKVICDNTSRFNSDELSNIYNKLNFDYHFEYNSLNYHKNDFNSCKMELLSKKG